ncbi:MAG: ABC transporter permease [Ruminococcus sp.]|nr:ABC transporter permease [Ruminococcus sp.]
MLFKLPLLNIKRSLRDYAIYFFTLLIGVAVFYVFNAIETQTAYIDVSKDTREMIKLMNTILSGVSVFVSVVLGLLIVYASRFLMKRRNKEFAIYLSLGMSKGSVSLMMLLETVLIGLGSLAAGLVLGVGLSQLMSAMVVNLFEADMTSFKFTFSGGATVKTVIYFGIMYIVVMIFNTITIGRCKLIDLISSGRRSEELKLRNPILSIVIFMISAAVLGWAYWRVGWSKTAMSERVLLLCILLGAVSTFFIFWSVSGLLLRVSMSIKRTYYRGLNCFTVRQISSRINTMVFSMAVICLMLFVTVCLLAVAFSLRTTLNEGLKKYCPVDFEISYYNLEDGEDFGSCEEVFREHGYEPEDYCDRCVSVHMYKGTVKVPDIVGKYMDEFADLSENNMMVTAPGSVLPVYSVGEYNALLDLRGTGEEKLSLEEDEFALLCNVDAVMPVYDKALKDGAEIEFNGRKLHNGYDKCVDGFVLISVSRGNPGVIIVPDSAAEGVEYMYEHFSGMYKESGKKDKRKADERFLAAFEESFKGFNTDAVLQGDGSEPAKKYAGELTKLQLGDTTIGVTAIGTFLALYIGLVFLITCGALLALKQLSEAADSVGRYDILRKIGTDEQDISRSLFRQTGIFFLLPMLLACIHTVAGMKFSRRVLDFFIKEGFVRSMVSTSVIILLIYGGYFVITYFMSRSMIRGRNDR